MVTTLGIGIGTIIALYGVITMILGRSYLFGGDTKCFTEKSVRLFAHISGAAEIVLGAAVIMFTLGQAMSFLVVMSWLSVAVIWIAAAWIVTLYITIPVKRIGIE